MSRWYDNEDAGDLRAQHDADASAALVEDRMEMVPTGGVLINTKYKSRCRKCGRPINRAGHAVWVKGHGCYHPACYPHTYREAAHTAYRERTIEIHCSKCGFMDESKVEFLDISEGPMGEDIMKFKCPTCGKVRESKRLGR